MATKLVLNPLTGNFDLVQDVSGFVLKAGDTMTGPLGIGVAPSYLLDVYGETTTEGINTNIGLNFTVVANPTTGANTLLAVPGNVDVGTHSYWVTFYTALGETNSYLIGGPTGYITATAGNQQVDVTIPVSSDPRVIGRKIYRTKAGASYYLDYLLADVPNNTDVSYIDNIADASLTGTSFQSARTNTTNKYITVNDSSVMILDNACTSFGIGTAASLTTAGSSTFFGKGAGNKVTTGNGNTLFGSNAGGKITTGADNVCIGQNAGRDMTTGGNNVFIGRNNALLHASGGENVCVGPYAMALASGAVSGNASLGMSALRSLTTGGYNTALGRQAGYDVTTGGYNIMIGPQQTTSVSITTGSYNILMGYDVRYGLSQTGSNQLVIGNLIIGTGLATGDTLSTGSIGIGITPSARFTLPAGSASASTAPLKFASGTLLTAAEAGAVEFLTDDFYATITTGAARKKFVLDDGTALTATRVPFATTNGRLTDDADFTFATDTLTATKIVGTTSVKVGTAAGYISSDGSTGATGTFTTADAKTVTVKDGIITNIV